MIRLLSLILLVTGLLPAAERSFPVRIQVDAAESLGELRPIYSFFGYDEPNYTYMKDGKKLLSQIADLSPVPVHIRAHNLLNTGQGEYGLKWGSSNAYTEDAAGHPIYDWTIVDRIFDTYVERGLKPLVEVGFMPKALTTGPEPYRHSFSLDPVNRDTRGGWAYPPKDYKKWAELVYQLARHCVERYGAREVETWFWEAWNEPNIGFWRGTAEQYYKLYDYTADAVKRALPAARFGGPHWAGSAGSPKWGRAFLEHALRGTNFATGKTGSPLDYVGFHAKGRPEVVDGHVRMGIARHLTNIEAGFKVIESFPELRETPVLIGESDPEGCAACSARVYPNNAYRNGTVYSSYTAASFARKHDLAALHGVNLIGALTWAFEFENQPYFDGFRTLASNGIEKPVLNVFRMFGLMGGQRIKSESSSQVDLETIKTAGVRGQPDVGALASRGERTVSVLVWHYHDDDVPGPDAEVALTVNGLPAGRRVLVKHFRIDRDYSNGYAAWQRLGSPQQPTPEQYAQLEREAGLHLYTSPAWKNATAGTAKLKFTLPRQGVSLVQLTW